MATPNMQDPRTITSLTSLLFYIILLVVTLSTISWTTYQYPLFPLNTESLEWSNQWLTATVVDYYGACLCLCGVILSTEPTWFQGSAWVVGCCLLGSPVCCAWILSKVWWQGKSLSLAESSLITSGGDGVQREEPLDEQTRYGTEIHR
jgi:hypothetical protein